MLQLANVTQPSSTKTALSPGYCGDSAHPIPIADFNADCIVDFKDFAVFAEHWLKCTRPICP